MHLFSKENIWSNPQQFPAYNPDKYNNSVDRIISKEEEREDPRRDTSVFFEYSGVSTYNPSHKISSNTVYSTVSSHAIQQLQVIQHTELILLQEILQLQGSSCADQYKASSSDCPRVSKHSTRQNKAPGFPTSIPGPYSTSRLPVILPGRNSIPSGSQHPHNPYSSYQAHPYRILSGEIGFIPKGLSIVCPCNTKVSVFQFTYSCA